MCSMAFLKRIILVVGATCANLGKILQKKILNILNAKGRLTKSTIILTDKGYCRIGENDPLSDSEIKCIVDFCVKNDIDLSELRKLWTE